MFSYRTKLWVLVSKFVGIGKNIGIDILTLLTFDIVLGQCEGHSPKEETVKWRNFAYTGGGEGGVSQSHSINVITCQVVFGIPNILRF